MATAKKGDSVKINYTGKLVDGTVFDTSEGHEPLGITLGSGSVIPGFEEAVLGMGVGESKNVTIPVDKAYGPRNEEMVIKAPRAHVPADINPEVGQKLQMGGPNGEMVVVQVLEVTIPVDKAYGPRNEEMVIKAPRAHVPDDIDPQVGQQLEMGGPKGEMIVVRVVEVTDEHVKLDANPPLAGQELIFDIELVEIA